VKDMHLLPELTPKMDETFMRLLEETIQGTLPLYFAAVPLRLCVPFDLDYRPDRHPIGKQAIQSEFARGVTGTLSPMIVYPRGAWFVVSDNYISLFAALLGNPEFVPCWVMGKPDEEYARDIQGPLDVNEVPKALGASQDEPQKQKREPSHAEAFLDRLSQVRRLRSERKQQSESQDQQKPTPGGTKSPN